MTEYLSKKIKMLSLLAMLMVVVAHTYCLTDRYLHPATMVQDPLTWQAFVQLFLANGFARFGIPLFFLMSGYLNYPKPGADFKAVATKRFRTLMVPYFIWGAFGLLLYWAAQYNELFWQATVRAALGSYSDIKVQDFTWIQLLYRWVVEPVPFQLWFLRCLFVYTLLTPLLIKALTKRPSLLLGVFGLLWFTNVGLYVVEGEGLLFFSLGLWIRHREVEVQTAPRWFRWWAVAGIWLALLALKTGLAFGPYAGPLPLIQLLLYRLCEPLGGLTIWFGYDRLMRYQVPSPNWLSLSHYTFILYGLHVPLLHLMRESLFLVYGETDTTRWWAFVIVIGVVTGFCFLTGILLRRYIRPVFSVLTGGRGTA